MEQFNYSRVDLARRRKGLSKAGLAEATGVSTRSLSKYEAKQSVPSEETIEALAQAVGFPSSFFYGPKIEEPPLDGTSFRALSKLTARERDRVLGSGALALRVSHWIDQRFDLPLPNIPNLDHLDPEQAAYELREQWGLGDGPLPNLIHLLESHGVKVFSLAEDCEDVDGFSFWSKSVPYVFLNTQKTAERSRMDAAHELGHLVLHRDGGPRGRTAEEQAHAFGAAFLMTGASVRERIPSGPEIPFLVRAKRYWKVALLNLARRCHKLGLLTEWQYRSICMQVSKRGRKIEPNPMRRRETSQVLEKVFSALQAQGLSKADVARELAIPPGEIQRSVFGLVLRPLDGSGAQVAGRPAQPELKLV